MTAARLPSIATSGQGAADGRFSAPMGLWCPWCRTPFVGTVDRMSGRFAHGSCPIAEVDVGRLEALARDSWFWDRFRARLRG